MDTDGQDSAGEADRPPTGAPAARARPDAAPPAGATWALLRGRWHEGPPPRSAPLAEVLAAYDHEVSGSLNRALTAPVGVDRVRELHNSLRRQIAVHDSIVLSALCPLLEDLPGGPRVAGTLRQGCAERARLLGEFDVVSRNVAARDVYPVSPGQIDEVLEGLRRSFEVHVRDETAEVARVLDSAATSIDPAVVAARMAIEAQRAPTRSHPLLVRHPRSALLRWLLRSWDRWYDWSDAHGDWGEPQPPSSPRATQVALLKRQAVRSRPSVRDLLVGYDATVEEEIERYRGAGDDEGAARSVEQLVAAITIHDSVLEGALCPLLSALPGGELLAIECRESCRQRSRQVLALEDLAGNRPIAQVLRERREELDAIIDPLVAGFETHRTEGTIEVAELLERLPAEVYRTRASPFADVMWPWHSEGPAALALRMALRAENAPERVRRLLVGHPDSRSIRVCYRAAGRLRELWTDSALERWLFPAVPPPPFSHLEHLEPGTGTPRGRRHAPDGGGADEEAGGPADRTG